MIFLNKNFLFPLSHPIKTRKSKKQGNHENKDDVYITRSLLSWKKVPKCFYSHQSWWCHRAASLYQLIVSQRKDIGKLMDNLFVRDRQVERKYLLEVIKRLRYLSRHGIPLQGHDGNGNFTQLSFISLERKIINHQ